MAVEIEAKIKVADLGVVRQRLQEVGAERVGEVMETNTFFDTEDRSLLAADRGLRLRQKRDLPSGAEKFFLTYKGPRRHGQLKSREEIEVMVADGARSAALLEALGYLRVLTFQKRRETWKLDECLIELDDLPHLGVFVEVEGPSEEQVIGVLDQLRLGDRPMVKASYIAMLMTHLQEHGIASRVVTFPAAGAKH